MRFRIRCNTLLCHGAGPELPVSSRFVSWFLTGNSVSIHRVQVTLLWISSEIFKPRDRQRWQMEVEGETEDNLNRESARGIGALHERAAKSGGNLKF